MVAQKITIEPVTRIEGHAKITIHMDENNQFVDHAYLHVNEFRGFEKFCEGRMVFEMPLITPRICGICPVSHHLAAAKAGDAVLGAPPPRPASLLRELMHMGQIIQSHGMHFFELAGPDLLLGFDADPVIRNVVGLVQNAPDITVKAVQLRKYGQEIIQTLGGRKIHPVFALPGGVNKALSHADRDSILKDLDQSIETIQLGLSIMKDWAARNMEDIQKFAVFPTGYFGLITEENGLELYEGNLRLIDRDGQQLERFPASNYLDYIGEHVENWSYLKFPFYKKMGYPDGVYRVGPLGRLNIADKIDTPLANEEFKAYRQINGGKPIENTLYYHYSRLIETLFAAERVKVLLDDPDIHSTDILNTRHNFQGEGVGVIEAPRGTLLHHYWANENGQIEKLNLIVSTGHNNYAMSKAVDMVAKTYVKGPDIHEGLLNRVEAAVRAHDPCLSCSTHAIGQMPMIIDIVDNEGKTINTLQRD
ncbi:MAG TPA: Ni/Fe hydrogenase subunit alpha [Anaerolineaceae bacterium]|nr:Ni/Fe hydrogenase subunit alpha [Anaerolineaceae bacterium]